MKRTSGYSYVERAAHILAFCVSYDTMRVQVVKEKRRMRSWGRQRRRFLHTGNPDEGDEIGEGLLVVICAER